VNRAAGIDEALATGADLCSPGTTIRRGSSRSSAARVAWSSHSTTLCDRTRGGLPAAFQEIEIAPGAFTVRACTWDAAVGDFTPRQDRVFAR
jgi:hypothetical protein